MCGIAGLLDPGGRVPTDELAHRVVRMIGTITHRGPDAEGTWTAPDVGVALGSVRLAVVGVGRSRHC